MFRDCNGESNGIELPEDTILAEAAANRNEEVVVFPDAEEELEELSQQVELVEEEEEEALSAALPLPVLDDLVTDHDEIPLNGLYQAPGAQ